MRLTADLDTLATEVLRETLDIEQPALLRATADPTHGDFQINAAMPLAKRLGKSPRDLAGPIADAMAATDPVARAHVAGPGFVNLKLDDAWLGSRLDALATDERDGIDEVTVPQTIVVDFSSPNIAKQMHVGHLRSTIIGDSLVRILRFAGHRVIGDNHIGDWGTQFGLLLVGMRAFGDESALNEQPIVELERVYREASEKAKEDPAFAEQARAELAKLQAGDEENTALWKRFVAATRAALEEVYGRLGVAFDEWLGESTYHSMLSGVVDRLLGEKLAREDQGAICVFFGELTGAPKEVARQKEPLIIRKRDGAFLYSTTDIATVLYRRDSMAADRAVYVVDKRQGQHFRQVFALAGLMGIELELDHVGFGMVLGPDGTPIRTRDASGKPVTLLSLLDEAETRAAARIRERDDLRIPEDEIENVARAVGIGAVKYADLSQNRTSDYKFDLDKMVTFEGDAGPYLQYQYARASSILRKAEEEGAAATGPVALETATERNLAIRLLKVGDQFHQALSTLQPHLLAEHLYDVAKSFSAFHRDCPVLKSSGATRASRLRLTTLTRRQLARCLDLLGIEAIERM